MYFLKSTQQKYNKRQSLKEETIKALKIKQYAQLYNWGKKCKCLKAMRFHFLSKLTKIKETESSANIGIKRDILICH